MPYRKMLTRALVAVAAVGMAGCGGDAADSVGGKDKIVVGQELYKRNGCPVCHGEQGRGDGTMAPSLSPPPRNFTDVKAYKSGADLEQIKASIRNGTGAMPAYAHLKAGDLQKIASFVHSLQQKP
jgi:mono/diheme cytochrome c family protein